MRRLLVAAVFFTLTPSTTFAGYVIIRVLLEGGGGSEGDGVPGGPGGVVQPPAASGGGRFGGGGGVPMPGPGPRPGPGGPGPGGMPPGSAPTTGLAEIDHARAIVVVIPLEVDFKEERLDQKLKFYNPDNNPKYYHLEAPYYGQKLKASVFVDSSTIQLYTQLLGTPALKKTRGTEMRDRYAVWAKGKTDAQALYDSIVLALRSGFVKEALGYSDELVKAAAGGLALPEREVKPFVAAWGAVQKAVTEPAPLPSDAQDWQGRLDYKSVTVQGHYALVCADTPPAEINRRLGQLNDNFAAFYLWHATRGVALPVPEKPLVAVLAQQGSAMRGLRSGLDGLPMSDAFYAPDHNLLVLSPERLDDVGQTFLRQNQQVFVKGLNRDQLLAGVIPKADFTGKDGPRPDDVARASTLAAVEKLAIDEADLAAVSREGSRQLLYTTGVLPRHVTLPTWLSNGSVNFFTRPRGPAYVALGEDEKPHMSVALTTGYGGPNYVLQRYFRDLAAKKELPADPARLLENVLGDVYFTGIKTGDDPDPAPPGKPKKAAPATGAPGSNPGPGPGPGPIGMPPRPGDGGMPGAQSDQEDPAITLRKKQQRLAIKANATSWALYYYLAKDEVRAAQLKEYIAELNKLPRDLPIDGRTAAAVFVRVFKLSVAPDGPADPALMKKFAAEWLGYINSVPLTSHDIPLTVAAPKPPTTGMPPGGMMPPPGGGVRPGGGS